MDAFSEVLQSRQVHQGGLGHLPLSEIITTRDDFGMSEDEDERRRFVRMIRALDKAYVGYMNEQYGERRKQKQSKAPAVAVPKRSKAR